MSGRHGHQRKKKKAPLPHAVVATVHEPPCQEHPDHQQEGDMKTDDSNTPKSPPNWTALIGLIVAVLALVVYFTQAYLMRQAMRVDQRAWVSVPIPANFPLNGAYIPANIEIKNSGKTPARNTGGNFVGTVLKKEKSRPLETSLLAMLTTNSRLG